MKTYLTITFTTEGGRPSEVSSLLQGIGFKPMTGNYDFVYSWPKKAVDPSETLDLADLVQATLKGMKVLFKFETV
jgi:hypothetical protein